MKRRAERQPSLPPSHNWLVAPGEKFETPLVSDLGVVDVAATIDLVKASIASDYEWDPMLSVHHFEWYGHLFPDIKQRGKPNPHAFRELPPLKGLMPREFENFLHEITLPTAPPSEEVMHYSIEAWRVANSLFKKAREVVQWERRRRHRRAFVAANPHIIGEGFDGRDPIGEEIMQEILEKDFRGVDTFRLQNNLIPVEFRHFNSEAPLHQVVGDIGRIAIPRSRVLYKAIAA